MSWGIPPTWRPDALVTPPDRFVPSARLGTPLARVWASTRPAWPRPLLRGAAAAGVLVPVEPLDPDQYAVFPPSVRIVAGAHRALLMDLHHRRALPLGLEPLAALQRWSERPLAHALAEHGELARRLVHTLLARELLVQVPDPGVLGARAGVGRWPGPLSELVLSWGPASSYPLAQRVREAEALGARGVLLRCTGDPQALDTVLAACEGTALNVEAWLSGATRWPTDAARLSRVVVWGSASAGSTDAPGGLAVETCPQPLALDALPAPALEQLVVDPELADAALEGHGVALGRLYVDAAGALRPTPLGPPLPADTLADALAHPQTEVLHHATRGSVLDCAPCALRLCCPDAEPLTPAPGGWRRARPCPLAGA